MNQARAVSSCGDVVSLPSETAPTHALGDNLAHCASQALSVLCAHADRDRRADLENVPDVLGGMTKLAAGHASRKGVVAD